MKIKKLIIKTKSRTYPVFIGPNSIFKLSKIMIDCSIRSKKCFLLIDNKVPRKMIAGIQSSLKKKKISFFSFNANEKNKNQKTINNILEILLKKNFSRDDCLISIGGGITGDLGGLAASLFKRGLHFIDG